MSSSKKRPAVSGGKAELPDHQQQVQSEPDREREHVARLLGELLAWIWWRTKTRQQEAQKEGEVT